MLKRTLLTSAAALAVGLGGYALSTAQDIPTIRMVSKDFVPSNPDDVRELEAIEAGMAAAGHPINIELTDIASSGYADKLGLMLLGGDIPDLIYFQGGDAKIVEQGLLEDWRPWLEQTEHLKNALWQHQEARLENYPWLLFTFPVRSKVPVIREEWLAATGLAEPQTVDEWLTLLRTIRDGDLDGNGAADTYAITSWNDPATGPTDEFDMIFNRAFGIQSTWVKDAEGNWIHSRVSPQERDKLAFYHQLFEEGLIDPEFVTDNWDVRETKFYTGRVGVVFGTIGKVIDIYQGKLRELHPDESVAVLGPPTGAGGQGIRAVDVSREARGFAMSSISENKEHVVALLDFMASPEGQMIDRMGFEGQEWVRNGDKIELTPAMNTWYERFMQVNTEAWTPPVPLLSEQALESVALADQYFTPDNSFVWPADYAAQLDALNQLYRSYVWKFVSGELPLDQWDAFVAEWYATGGEAITEYARTVLNGQG